MSSNDLEAMSHNHAIAGELAADVSSDAQLNSPSSKPPLSPLIDSSHKVKVLTNGEATKSVQVSAAKRRKVMLETRGYRVLAYSDAQQAIERFGQGGVDLVLTDLIMPGIDGSKLIENVKFISPETPAILLSGKVKVYEHETGADVFLAKGMYAPADLLERIRLLLVRKRGPKRAIARSIAQVTPPPAHRTASA